MWKERINRASAFKKDFREGKCKIGAHVFLLDPSITEALALCGYDYIWIDGEHSPFSAEIILSHIFAAASGNAASFVRVPWNNHVLLKPIQEMNPDGVIIPFINNSEEAAKAVSACRYPPKGIRGLSPRRANNYGNMNFSAYIENVENSFLIIIQIETMTAVNNIESIIKTDGIDAVIIGPLDLSASMGLIGNIKHENVITACDKAIEACKKFEKPCGIAIGPMDLDYFKSWISKGVNLISCGDDISFIQMGSRRVLDSAREIQSSS